MSTAVVANQSLDSASPLISDIERTRSSHFAEKHVSQHDLHAGSPGIFRAMALTALAGIVLWYSAFKILAVFLHWH